jgi:hypothetical protein
MTAPGPVGGPYPFTLASIEAMNNNNDDPMKDFADSVGVLNSVDGLGGLPTPF